MVPRQALPASVTAADEPIALEILPGAGAQLRVALVIFTALAIAATLCYLLTGAGAQLFAAHTTLTTLVPDTSGVGPGSDVRLSGIPIGKVSGVAISGLSDPQRIVRISMRVDASYLRNIPRDSKAVITEDNLLGNQFVSIDEGKSPQPVAENAFLDGVPLQQAADRADLIKALQHELSQADDLFTQLSSPKTAIGQIVLGSKEYDEILRGLAAFNTSLHSFVSPDTPVGQALFSDKLYNDIRKYIADTDKTLEAIQNGPLLASDKDYNDLLAELRGLHKSLSDINAGRTGILHDEAAYKQIRDMLAKTDAAIAALNGNALMNDRKTYDSLTATLRSLQARLLDIRTDPKKYLRYKAR